jgi:hypothetical protein
MLYCQDTDISSCAVCCHPALDVIWDLPKLPLTEKLGIFDAKKELCKDQKLLICEHCGHVQLGKQISPQTLYSPSEYSFRTSQSNTARHGTQLFFKFFERIKGPNQFHSLLDIGGNDLFLAKMTQCQDRCVIDPVGANEDGQIIDGVKVIGKLIEHVDFKKEGLQPDLIFCRHVLEHVSKPKELLDRLFQECDPNALYVFEIPCFENLMEANRFDAIFHQHYHYFDLGSFQRMIAEAGGLYIDHVYNRQGSCGGALLIAFRKAKTKVSFDIHDLKLRKEKINQAIREYKSQARLISSQLQKLNKNIYGYGASLMLATLGYHLNTDFSELICILDDDQQKDNIGYQNIPVKVRYTGSIKIEPNANFIITSLENTRSIFKRISELSPRRVILPLVC